MIVKIVWNWVNNVWLHLCIHRHGVHRQMGLHVVVRLGHRLCVWLWWIHVLLGWRYEIALLYLISRLAIVTATTLSACRLHLFSIKNN